MTVRVRGGWPILLGLTVAFMVFGSPVYAPEAAAQGFPNLFQQRSTPKPPPPRSTGTRQARPKQTRRAQPAPSSTDQGATQNRAAPDRGKQTAPVPVPAPGRAPAKPASTSAKPAPASPAQTPAVSPQAPAKPAAEATKAESPTPGAKRLSLPPGIWAGPTAEAMFAPGRLITLDEYPQLGSRFRPAPGPGTEKEPAPATPPAADAGGVSPAPLPRPKDGPVADAAEPAVEAQPASDPDCTDLAAAGVVSVAAEPVTPTPAGCGMPHPVTVSGFETTEGRVTLQPAAIMRCGVAKALAAWVREDVSRLGQEKLGLKLRGLQNASSYVCRPRNNVSGAQLSEHGLGNALDVSGFAFEGGRVIAIGEAGDDKGFADEARKAACRHLTTVLGPGTDSEHGNHLHLDLRIRSNGYRICQ